MLFCNSTVDKKAPRDDVSLYYWFSWRSGSVLNKWLFPWPKSQYYIIWLSNCWLECTDVSLSYTIGFHGVQVLGWTSGRGIQRGVGGCQALNWWLGDVMVVFYGMCSIVSLVSILWYLMYVYYCNYVFYGMCIIVSIFWFVCYCKYIIVFVLLYDCILWYLNNCMCFMECVLSLVYNGMGVGVSILWYTCICYCLCFMVCVLLLVWLYVYYGMLLLYVYQCICIMVCVLWYVYFGMLNEVIPYRLMNLFFVL